MSWLWDVEFAPVLQGKSGWLATTGTRAADMAVRLHYDSIETDLIEPDLATAIRTAASRVSPDETVVIFSTYTAMWELHRILTRIAA
jgi:hypothetical protein